MQKTRAARVVLSTAAPTNPQAAFHSRSVRRSAVSIDSTIQITFMARQHNAIYLLCLHITAHSLSRTKREHTAIQTFSACSDCLSPDQRTMNAARARVQKAIYSIFDCILIRRRSGISLIGTQLTRKFLLLLLRLECFVKCSPLS